MITEFRPSQEVVDRFWGKVDASAGPDECWGFAGYKVGGYGRVSVGSRQWLAHRFSFLINYGFIDSDLDVCHTCDNPACVNPQHLWLGSHSDNMKDMVVKGRAGPPKKDLHPRAVLTEAQVVEIRERYASGEKAIPLASEFRVSAHAIRDIVSGRSWKGSPGPRTLRRYNQR